MTTVQSYMKGRAKGITDVCREVEGIWGDIRGKKNTVQFCMPRENAAQRISEEGSKVENVSVKRHGDRTIKAMGEKGGAFIIT